MVVSLAVSMEHALLYNIDIAVLCHCGRKLRRKAGEEGVLLEMAMEESSAKCRWHTGIS